LGLKDIFQPNELVTKQDQDKDLYKIKSWLKSQDQPSQKELTLSSPSVKYFWSCKSQLYMKDNILYYLWEDSVKPRYLFVAPKNMQYEILKYCHDNKTAGHTGQANTYENLKQCSIWYGMSKDAKLYVEGCGICNHNKKPSIKPKAALGQYHAGSPLERVHIDILGPLPVTIGGISTFL
jgi:hypothetical protein